MKYHAILTDPGNLTQERVQQIHTNRLADVEVWVYGESGEEAGLDRAKGVFSLAKSPDAFVEVFEIVEVKRAVLPRKRPEKSPSNG